MFILKSTSWINLRLVLLTMPLDIYILQRKSSSFLPRCNTGRIDRCRLVYTCHTSSHWIVWQMSPYLCRVYHSGDNKNPHVTKIYLMLKKMNITWNQFSLESCTSTLFALEKYLQKCVIQCSKSKVHIWQFLFQNAWNIKSKLFRIKKLMLWSVRPYVVTKRLIIIYISSIKCKCY